MFDLVIRGGTIVDGTGGAPYTGDVAISNGKIVAVGKVEGQSRDEIDASGRLVTPGFIDIHSHYDAQLLWDDQLDPSFSNGITTIFGGICGVGLAPLHEEHRIKLVEMMEGVEDIPGIILDKGIDWDWESFSDYLDKIAARQYTMDIGMHLAHAPLRIYVMGERALTRDEATAAEIEQMAGLVREAMSAGAIGVSIGRMVDHKSSKGEEVAGTYAGHEELLALARAMGESGKGVLQVIPRGDGGDTAGNPATPAEREQEHELLVELARAAGRPLTYLLQEYTYDPDDWRTMMERSRRANDEGVQLHPQIAARATGLILGLDGYHPFRSRPSYIAVADLPVAKRAQALREPARRTAILAEANVPIEQAATPRIHFLAERFAKQIDLFHVIDSPDGYEPDDSMLVPNIAKATGRTSLEVAYDTLAEGEGKNLLAMFVLNYAQGNLDSTCDMMADAITLSGLADGGAHLQMICDSSISTYHLTFWARDRKRGRRLPIDHMIHKLTGASADAYGLDDRGVIATGKRADLNVIDFEKLGNDLPRMVHDLPFGGARYVQSARGYDLTMVNGVVTRRNDQDTGARPGRLLRTMNS